MGSGRIGRWVAAVAVAALVVGACGADPTPAADVAPQIDEACEELRENLEVLAASRSDPPTVDDVDAVEDSFYDTYNDLPDEETTVGRPTTVLGNSIQQLRRALFDLEGAYNDRDIDADLSGVVSELDEAITGLNAGTTEFGLDLCVDADVVGPELIALVDGFEATRAELEPTGDFTLDFAAACARYRSDVTQTVLEAVGDPNNQFLGPIRAAGVMDRFASDLGNFTSTEEFRDDYDGLLAVLQDAATAAGRIDAVRTVSQEAIDEAVADFAAAEEDVNAAIATIDPTC